MGQADVVFVYLLAAHGVIIGVWRDFSRMNYGGAIRLAPKFASLIGVRVEVHASGAFGSD